MEGIFWEDGGWCQEDRAAEMVGVAPKASHSLKERAEAPRSSPGVSHKPSEDGVSAQKNHPTTPGATSESFFLAMSPQQPSSSIKGL